MARKNTAKKDIFWRRLPVVVPIIVVVIASVLEADFIKLFVVGGSGLVNTPTEAATLTATPTLTLTPTLTPSSTATVTVEPTVTAVPPSATSMPSLCCLSGWDVFSTISASFSSVAQNNCPNAGIDELGIHSSSCGLTLGLNGLKQPAVSGLSMSIPHNAKIQLTFVVNNLKEGELWVGLSKDVDPQSNSLIYAVTPDPGGVSVYLGNSSNRNAQYDWKPMADNVGWTRGQAWVYKFEIQLDGSQVVAEVDDVRLAAVATPSTNRLFIGYRAKPEMLGTYLKAFISKLVIASSP